MQCPAGNSSTVEYPCGQIDGPPLNGSVTNLVLPLGYVALAMHFGAVFIHVLVFGTWAGSRAKMTASDITELQIATDS
eukprot:SAG22_NODE_303_length_12721_cov_3.439075_2_plen_78_part_00